MTCSRCQGMDPNCNVCHEAKSTCQGCGNVVFDYLKKFDDALGFVCPDCKKFLSESEKELLAAGMEGLATKHEP